MDKNPTVAKNTLELQIRKLRTELSFKWSAKAHGGPDFKDEIKQLNAQIHQLEDELECSKNS